MTRYPDGGNENFNRPHCLASGALSTIRYNWRLGATTFVCHLSGSLKLSFTPVVVIQDMKIVGKAGFSNVIAMLFRLDNDKLTMPASRVSVDLFVQNLTMAATFS